MAASIGSSHRSCHTVAAASIALRLPLLLLATLLAVVATAAAITMLLVA
jgi:hypothetical protein